MLNKEVLQFSMKKKGEGEVDKLVAFEPAAPRAEGLPEATHHQLKACVHSEELHLGKSQAAARFGVTSTSPLREGTNGESCARSTMGLNYVSNARGAAAGRVAHFFGTRYETKKQGRGGAGRQGSISGRAAKRPAK